MEGAANRATTAYVQVERGGSFKPSSQENPKVKSVPTHARVQSPAVGGISKAAVRAVVGAEMMPHDPSQVQGVDLGLSGRATLSEW